MAAFEELVHDFLAQRRIAVAGVSRESSQAANFVFRKLRDSGHEAIPVNPSAQELEGAKCYPDLGSIPGAIDGVMVVTRPEVALDVVRQCTARGVTRVWMHRSFGTGSVSDAAVQHCRDHGIRVIAGGCPLMFCEPVDVGHRCMRWLLRVGGKLR